MLYACERNVMDVFSVCIVRRGAVGARIWKFQFFVVHMFVSCLHSEAVLNVPHDLQFVNAGRG